MVYKIPHISNKIPSYILEQYPNFVLFVKGYYEWYCSENRPYNVLTNHLERLSFDESLDEYANHLKNKYLSSIPQDVMASKELMIKWSKKFWQSKGSQSSYEFLFNCLFNQSVDIYLPKNDLFRLSDGKWVDDESTMFIVPTKDVADDAFLYRKITQKREIYTNTYETATANVQRVSIRTYGGYKLYQLFLSNIKGTFESGYTISNDSGDTAHIMNISSGYTINSAGTNFQEDDILYSTTLPETYDVSYNVSTTDVNNGYLDTKIKTILRVTDLVFKKNGVVFVPTYDGQFISYDSMAFDDVITVTYPTYSGLISVSAVNGSSIKTINILDPIIGNFNTVTLDHSNMGTGASIELSFDTIAKRQGYFKNNDSMLSSDRYLQDSVYYQDYAYVLRTEVDISRYRDIVKQTIHPAGMKLFGMVSIADVINLIVNISESFSILPYIKNYMPKYRLGPNLSMIEKLKGNLDESVWRVRQYRNIPGAFFFGEPSVSTYKLYDYSLYVKGLFNDAQRQSADERGWMLSDGFADEVISTSRTVGYVKDDYVASGYITDSSYSEIGYGASGYGNAYGK